MLSFALGSIPIRVHLSFWMTAAFLGMNNSDPLNLLIWVAVVFVSVLFHELGHALMGKAFGLAPQVELYAFGGATSWAEGNRLSSGKRVLVSLAGPLAGLLLWGIVYVCQANVAVGSRPLLVFFGFMAYVNLVWSIFNLLPILPLDGGNVMAHTFAAFTRGGGRRAAHIVSIVVAVLIAVYLLLDGFRHLFAVIWLGLFAFQNARALAPARNEQPPARQQW